MKKMIVIGNNGSGKSTFSTKIGKKFKLPVIHLDLYFHLSGWRKRPNDEWLKMHDEFISRKEWVIDGTYLKTLESRIRASDTIIFLDIPKWMTLYRIIKRRIIYRKSRRPDIPRMLSEQISFVLLRKNLTFSRKKIYRIINKYRDVKKIIVLKNDKEIDRFLKEV